MNKKNLLLSVVLGVMMLSLVSSTFPTFQDFSNNNGTLRGSGTATLGVNVTHTNGTALLNFDGTDYPATNTTMLSATNSSIFNVSLNLNNEDGGTYAYYWKSYSDNATGNSNVSATYNYVLLTKMSSEGGQQVYKTLEGTGAGLGIFLVYLSQSLPVLLVVLALIGIIVVIGFSIAHVVKKSITKGR